MLDKEKIKPFVNAFKGEKDVKVFIHNKINENSLLLMLVSLIGANVIEKIKSDDKEAHIITGTKDSVAYVIGNEIYFIPAKIKPVPFGITSDNKVLIAFDYPCEMKVEDLEEF